MELRTIEEKLRTTYSDFIGRNIAFCGLVPFNKIPKGFIKMIVEEE